MWSAGPTEGSGVTGTTPRAVTGRVRVQPTHAARPGSARRRLHAQPGAGAHNPGRLAEPALGGSPFCVREPGQSSVLSVPASARPSVKYGAIRLSNTVSAEPIAMCMSRYL